MRRTRPPSWDTTAQADGQYDLRVVTTDNAGNSFTSATITVRVDNTNPTGSVTNPADAADIAAPSCSRATPPTRRLGRRHRHLPALPGGRRHLDEPGRELEHEPRRADGQYDLRVVTTDFAGNSVTSAPITVRVDNTDPTGSITAPADSANVRGTSRL